MAAGSANGSATTTVVSDPLTAYLNPVTTISSTLTASSSTTLHPTSSLSFIAAANTAQLGDDESGESVLTTLTPATNSTAKTVTNPSINSSFVYLSSQCDHCKLTFRTPGELIKHKKVSYIFNLLYN